MLISVFIIYWDYFRSFCLSLTNRLLNAHHFSSEAWTVSDVRFRRRQTATPGQGTNSTPTNSGSTFGSFSLRLSCGISSKIYVHTKIHWSTVLLLLSTKSSVNRRLWQFWTSVRRVVFAERHEQSRKYSCTHNFTRWSSKIYRHSLSTGYSLLVAERIDSQGCHVKLAKRNSSKDQWEKFHRLFDKRYR